MTRLYITSATGALSAANAPVGGGVAVLEALLPHLERESLDYTLLTPGPADASAPHRRTLAVPTLRGAADDRLLHLSEREYARFALEWEAALGEFFANLPPDGAVVLANDISEGPPFRALREQGFRQIAVFHVVVAEFFARRYLRRLPIRAPQAAALWRGAERLDITRFAPDIARLVWQKEGQAVQHADALLLPSAPLAASLAACYPQADPAPRAQVIEWGTIGEADPSRREQRPAALTTIGADRNRFQLLTLSRISPEKRIELLLEALEIIERQSPSTAQRLELTIAGAPAYMGGEAYLKRLRAQARSLREIPVHVPGYISAPLKWDLLSAADLFCSPSIYEAYGLTIAQALSAGTPVLAADHEGAQAIITPEIGWIADGRPVEFAAAIRRALAARETGELRAMRRSAARWGAAHDFSHAASRIIQLVRTLSQEAKSP